MLSAPGLHVHCIGMLNELGKGCTGGGKGRDNEKWNLRCKLTGMEEGDSYYDTS